MVGVCFMAFPSIPENAGRPHLPPYRRSRLSHFYTRPIGTAHTRAGIGHLQVSGFVRDTRESDYRRTAGTVAAPRPFFNDAGRNFLRPASGVGRYLAGLPPDSRISRPLDFHSAHYPSR